MRLLPRFMLLMAALGLQACATCHTRDTVNIRPAGALHGFVLLDTHPSRSQLLLPGVMEIGVSECIPGADAAVCLILRIPAGATALFTQQQFTVIRPGEAAVTHAFPVQVQRQYCNAKDDQPMACDAVYGVPGGTMLARTLVSTTHSGPSHRQTWEYTFSPPTSFGGGTARHTPDQWRLFSASAYWPSYRIQVMPTAGADDRDTILRLPDLAIDGRTYAIPPLTVKRGPTTSCHSAV